MGLHEANMDIQIVSDPWCCCEYMTDYITKAEAGRSDVLKSLDEEGKNLTKMGVLDAISVNIDKKREVSIQEGSYRLLRLPMVKSSVLVKFVNTNHPRKRDRLLKGNIFELEDGESPFHSNIVDYYQCRPRNDIMNSDEDFLDSYNIHSWEDMCLADFVSCFNIVYGKKKEKLEPSQSEFELLNGKGRIRLRSKRAILRYFLKYENDIEMKRGKLILFLPFRDEMKDIHERDIDQLYDKNLLKIVDNQRKYEFKFQGRSMAEILSEFEESRENLEDEDEDTELLETTTNEELSDFQKDFDKWISEGSKGLASLKQFVDILQVEEHGKLIGDLNSQQRKIHDDLCERADAIDEEKEPFHVFISGTSLLFLCQFVCIHIYVKLG